MTLEEVQLAKPLFSLKELVSDVKYCYQIVHDSYSNYRHTVNIYNI